jgi:putative endonuclease
VEYQPAVYVLASKRNGTLYTGVTSDLVKRVHEHRTDVIGGFTKQYGVKRLVYFEFGDDMLAMIAREKQLKRWRRSWKLELIDANNPNWDDLYDDIT